MNILVGFFIVFAFVLIVIAVIRFRGSHFGIQEEDCDKYNISGYCKFMGVFTLIAAVICAGFAAMAFNEPHWILENPIRPVALLVFFLSLGSLCAKKKFRIAPLTEEDKRKRRVEWITFVCCAVVVIVFAAISF